METREKSNSLTLWHIAFLTLIGAILFWLFPLKLIARLAARRGLHTPCPSALGWLVNNPIRRWYTRHLLDAVGIKAGETVLELGCGPGTFTVEAAQRLGPTGKLIAVDIQPRMIAQAERRVREAGLTNVEFHVAGAYELPIDDESIDRAFLITVLPEIPDQPRALRELHRVLKPTGLLSISEELLDPDYPLPQETLRRVRAAGFSLERQTGNFLVYTLNFWKGEGFAYD